MSTEKSYTVTFIVEGTPEKARSFLHALDRELDAGTLQSAIGHDGMIKSVTLENTTLAKELTDRGCMGCNGLTEMEARAYKTPCHNGVSAYPVDIMLCEPCAYVLAEKMESWLEESRSEAKKSQRPCSCGNLANGVGLDGQLICDWCKTNGEDRSIRMSVTDETLQRFAAGDHHIFPTEWQDMARELIEQRALVARLRSLVKSDFKRIIDLVDAVEAMKSVTCKTNGEDRPGRASMEALRHARETFSAEDIEVIESGFLDRPRTRPITFGSPPTIVVGNVPAGDPVAVADAPFDYYGDTGDGKGLQAALVAAAASEIHTHVHVRRGVYGPGAQLDPIGEEVGSEPSRSTVNRMLVDLFGEESYDEGSGWSSDLAESLRIRPVARSSALFEEEE
jgi:hypothetical protein